MPYIWRVEMDGTGPFNEDHPYWDDLREIIEYPAPETNKSAVEMPFLEGWHGHPMDGDLFGFNSPEQLDYWFPKSTRSKLADCGFIGAVYKIERPYWRDGLQTKARRDKATLILNWKLDQHPAPDL